MYRFGILVALFAFAIVTNVAHSQTPEGEERVSAAIARVQRLCPTEVDNAIGMSVQRMNDVAIQAGARTIVVAEASTFGLMSAYRRMLRSTPSIENSLASAAVAGMASALSEDCGNAFFSEAE